jgi:putative methionine-R-sulfoxide reductase with GAF domain
MPASAFLNIPELDSFDHQEIDANPVLNTHEPVPLIGALLIAEGLITREQLNACLLLQAQDYPGVPLGQILLRCGYISASALDRALDAQRDLKASLLDRLEEQTPPPADLSALVLHRQGHDLANGVLPNLGVAASAMSEWAELRMACEERRPDMLLVDADLLDDTTSLPDQSTTPVLLLPPALFADDRAPQLPPWVRTIIGRFVGQVRAQRRQRDILDQLHQREFELNVVAAMSRSMAAARSPRDALLQLMVTIRDLFGVEAGTLYRLDRATSQLVFEVVLGPHQETLYQQCLPIDRGIAGWVVRNGEPLLIPDVQRDSRFEGMFDHQNGFQTRSLLCVPLIAMGEVRGVLQLINKQGGEFNERDLLLSRILAAVGALVEALAPRAIADCRL